jgi:branched-chain amino acid aminotransferase
MLHGSLDGEVMPVDEMRIPVTDKGLIRGDGVFEVVRLFEGRPFALREHLERMQRSADNLRLPLDMDAVRADIARLAEAEPGHDGVLRAFVTRGGRRVVLHEPLPQLPPVMRVATVTYAPTRILDGIKSLSYAGNMLATRLAMERGFDEALLVTPHGRVLEAPTSSFFWVKDGALCTPPLSDHVLASITRGRLLELMEVEERSCTLDDVRAADEAFLASTVREALPLAAVDDIELAVDGPITAEAGRVLRERIAEELAAG